VTIFRFADNLSLRVGRRGVWIYVPDVSAVPIYLDTRALRDAGLPILCTVAGEQPEPAAEPNRRPSSPDRTS
jgi:hypothetical protein